MKCSIAASVAFGVCSIVRPVPVEPSTAAAAAAAAAACCRGPGES